MDKIMLKTWLTEVSKVQAEVNNTISYQRGGRLDWETNQYKLRVAVTNNGASAPEPIHFTTDACFSTPTVNMGRRRVDGLKWLREVSRGAPKANKASIDNIINFDESSDIAHLKTAETTWRG